MIALTRLNQTPILLNSDLIETVETTPDTIIRLTNGQKLVVCEDADQVLRKVVAFRISMNQQSGRPNA